MREILFRGKQKNNGDWVEGFYVMHSVSIGHPYSYTNGKHCIQTVPHNIQYEVDPKTVCQYTGLTDKNGRKIFEGDIVRYSEIGAFGKVVWYEGDYIGFAVDDIDDSFQQYDEDLFGKAEIIGNIFDNPKLMEVENEID